MCLAATWCDGSVANPTNGISSSRQCARQSTAAGTGTIPGHLRTAVHRRGANPATAVRQCRLASRHDPREPGYGGGSHAQKLCGEVGCVACVSSACSPQLDVVAGGGGEAAGRRGKPAAGLRWPLAAWPRPERAGPLHSHPTYAGVAGASGTPTHAGMAGAPRSHGHECSSRRRRG